MKKNNLSLSSIFRNNKMILVLSVLIAVAIWVAVSPTGERVFSDVPLTVSIKDAPPLEKRGLQVIEGDTHSIKVKINGRKFAISSLTKDDIKLFISLDGIDENESVHMLDVKYEPSDSYKIVEIIPAKVKVVIGRIDTMRFTAEVIASGIIPDEGLVADPPMLADGRTTIEITGRKQELELIGHVRVIAQIKENEKNLSATKSFPAVLEITDHYNNVLPLDKYNFTNDLNDTMVTVPIVKKKTVPIKAVFTGAPPDFENNVLPHTLDMKEALISGPPDVVDKLTELKLQPVDFSEISPSSDSFDLKLELPPGITAPNTPEFIKLQINTDNLKSVTFDVVSAKAAEDITSDITVEILKKTVIIIGNKDITDKLTANDFYFMYNIGELGEAKGRHTLVANVVCTKSGAVWAFGSYQVQINIK